MTTLPRFLTVLRVTALVEAVSYLLLLGVAYVWRIPVAVKVVGMVHGVLFLVVTWLLMRAHFEAGWPRARVALVFGASLVPVWPFFLDRRVREWIAGSCPA